MKQITNLYLQTALLVFLLVVVASVGILVFVGAPPDNIVSLNSTLHMAAEAMAVITGILCFPGILCIFIKKIRIPLLIIVAVILLSFFAFCCLNIAYERLNYSFAKDKELHQRTCVITAHQHTHQDDGFAFRFLDNGQEVTLSENKSAPFYHYVEEGDTCVAYILTGAFGIDYIVDMRVKRRGRNR